MDEVGIIAGVLNALNAAKLPHMLVGSLSSNVYGIPRSTKDADLVVQLGKFPINELMEHLPQGYKLDPQIGFETVTSTTKYCLNYVGSTTPFVIEIFELSDDKHDQLRFSQRREFQFGEVKTWVPKAEDVVVTKLRWALSGKNREKDADDVRNVLATQKGKLDLAYIRQWVDRHGTRELLEKLLASVAHLPDALA